MRVFLIAAILAASSVPARSECLSSASAVWALHPGSHPNWRLRLPGHVGEKCWYAKNSTNLPAAEVRQEPVLNSLRKTESELRTDGPAKQAGGPVNVSAADRPDEKPATTKSQESVPAQQGGSTSILIWGKPMGLDAAWQEIFSRRERRAE
jgi:hypothetical protein